VSLTLDQTVEALRAAAETTRLRILALLAREELAVLELTRILGQSQPRVSRHLKLLADAGLVERFPDGAWVFYRLVSKGPARRVIDEALVLTAPSDPTLLRDLDRLRQVSAERAAQASDYFARNAQRWDEIRSLHTAESEVEQAILAVAGPGPFERLIDLGTGTGRILNLLASRAKTGLGLDLSRQMLNIARSNITGQSNLEVRHGDIQTTGLDDGAGDLVIVHQVLHFLSEPGAAVAEAARLTAPEGRLLIIDFAPHNLEFLREAENHRRLGFSDHEMAGWFAQAGLEGFRATALAPRAAGGLTVKIWTATRPEAKLRRVVGWTE
jgi:DNA-binding transcriptional ArsR family regulator/ubiquinone/menaquinone biosynthesis C-methylase UbiE